MKILILMGKFSGGGAQRAISYLSEHSPSSYTFTMIVEKEEKGYPFRGEVKVINLLPFTRKLQLHIHAARFFQKIYLIRKIVVSQSFQVVLAADPRWALVGAFSSKKLIFMVQNNLSHSYGINLWQRLVIKFIRFRAVALVAVSTGVAEELESVYGVHCDTVIHNPISREKILQEVEKGIPNEKFLNFRDEKIPLVITLGRSVPQKAHDHLIRSFALLLKKQPAKLVLVGNGIATNPAVIKALDEKNLAAEDVLILPFQKNPFVYLQFADIFVLPSIFEGFGNVCVEAMALGIPVISTDCPYGPREILAPGTKRLTALMNIEYGTFGVLTPVPSAVDRETAEKRMAEAMERLLVDQQLLKKYGAASLERSKVFDTTEFVAAWKKLFNEKIKHTVNVS